MEYKVSVPEIASPAWDKDGVISTVEAKLAEYTNVVYTPDRVRAAKADRAELNKLAKAIDDERKRVKNLYLAPYEGFEKEVKKIVARIDSVTTEIDKQVKTFEAQERANKTESIRQIFNTHEWHGITFETVFKATWANASTSLSSVTAELEQMAQGVATDVAAIEQMGGEYTFEALETYKATMSLSSAMQTVNALKDAAKRRAEYEAQKAAEEPVKAEEKKEEPKDREITYTADGMPDFSAFGDPRKTIIVRAKVSEADGEALRKWLDDNGIEYEIMEG